MKNAINMTKEKKGYYVGLLKDSHSVKNHGIATDSFEDKIYACMTLWTKF